MDSDDEDLDLRVTRFALNYNPPTLVVEFKRNKKRYIKKIRIKINADVNAKRLTQGIVKHNYELLNENMVCHDQLLELMELLLMTQEQNEATLRPNRSESPVQDLNCVTEEENLLAKSRMSIQFEENRLKPGDPGFEYDKRIDFHPPEVESGWDDEE